MSRPQATRRSVLAFALELPGAYLDHPWGEDVAKVNKKVFAFLGTGDRADPAMSVKLLDSREQALFSPGAEPTGYGLGRAGWVTVPFKDAPPLGFFGNALVGDLFFCGLLFGAHAWLSRRYFRPVSVSTLARTG